MSGTLIPDDNRPEYANFGQPVKRCGSCSWTPYLCTGDSEVCALTGSTVSAWTPACSLHTPGQATAVGTIFKTQEEILNE